jgi:tetratricopeptide (TPR) repeat protein
MKTIVLFQLVLLSAASYAATPAETAIQKAQTAIAGHPDHYPYYNSLAMAYARRARESSDVAFYARAEETLAKSFAISPANFEGLKIETWLQLGRHEFAKARETAQKLNQQAPDDLTVYGYLVDANAELGHYKDAVDAAQWMLDLRPGNVPGLTRAGYLRELHGNLSGSLEVMQMAYDSTPFSEAEDRAWLLTQMAHLSLISGDLSKAEMWANGALGLFPNYHYALGTLAQVRIAQERYPEAVTLLARRYAAAPHAENLSVLAEAQELAGQNDSALQSYATFERQSLVESPMADNSNHELIAYYVDHAHKPAEALAIARREVERRQDVYTLDTYAWALAASGDYEQAETQMRTALAVGVKEPRLLFHAGAIALHLRHNDQAAMYLKDAASRHSREALKLLRSMPGKPGDGSN